MNTKILAFAGQLGSGKSSCSNFVVGTVLWGLRIVRDTYSVREDTGKLWVSDLFGDVSAEGIFDMRRVRELRNIESLRILHEEIYPNIKQYAFADKLKELAVDILGLDPKLVYGSQKDKEQKSHLRWEDMPGVVTPDYVVNYVEESGMATTGTAKKMAKSGKFCNNIVHEKGQMTVREVLQFVGTEIFRKMHSNVWVNATLRQIEMEEPLFATIDDLRFKSEAEAIKAAGGTIIKLTRNENKEAAHQSENDLLNYDGYDYVIDNAGMTVQEQNAGIRDIMQELGMLGDVLQGSN